MGNRLVKELDEILMQRASRGDPIVVEADLEQIYIGGYEV